MVQRLQIKLRDLSHLNDKKRCHLLALLPMDILRVRSPTREKENVLLIFIIEIEYIHHCKRSCTTFTEKNKQQYCPIRFNFRVEIKEQLCIHSHFCDIHTYIHLWSSCTLCVYIICFDIFIQKHIIIKKVLEEGCYKNLFVTYILLLSISCVI